ncbi:Translation initiation factor 2 subunit gamma [Candidatus Gugararchaeum adminiculabundum]|nr:Translation initiation factor 2 subunit gamma [Candidatus Gugararchaeum adminiculabundum]
MEQAEINIGTLGHVDHGKTSVVKALTGIWTDKHSEELKRGISIRLGFADVIIRQCTKCKGEPYTTQEKCPACKTKPKDVRRVSFIDAPGHETLMATAIAASSIMDAVMLVIGANEKCPQPQTEEHLMVLDVLGIKNIIVVQNKIDLVTKQKALENYKEIKAFLKGSVAEKAPIVPVAANFNTNIDKLIEAIQTYFPTPKRNDKADPLMYVARSFDINKPGTDVGKIAGGVIGGSIVQGKFAVGDKIEIRPGYSVEEKNSIKTHALETEIIAIHSEKNTLKKAAPGGLVALETLLDPSLTKNDGMVGNIVGKPGSLPPVVDKLDLEFKLFARQGIDNSPLKQAEPVVVSAGTATALGFVEKVKKNKLELKLKRPICAMPGMKVALSRRIGQRWRLSGYGILPKSNSD